MSSAPSASRCSCCRAPLAAAPPCLPVRRCGMPGAPANGTPAPLPPPGVAKPRIAFTDDSDHVEIVRQGGSPVTRLDHGDHTGESTGAERGSGTVLVATQDEPNGEIYLEVDGSLGRITCNAAVETHPELSRDRRMVAYSSNESGEEHLWVAWPYGRTDPNNWTLKPCAEMDRAMLTKAPGRDVWPSWVDGTRLVFSSTRSDPSGRHLDDSRQRGGPGRSRQQGEAVDRRSSRRDATGGGDGPDRAVESVQYQHRDDHNNDHDDHDANAAVRMCWARVPVGGGLHDD